MSRTKSDEKLKSLIKESVKEVFDSEIMKLRSSALASVSNEEQKDIENRYGSPSKEKSREEEVDI